MTGVLNRVSNVVCEVGPCTWGATHTEHVIVIPGDPALQHERHAIDVVLCCRHEEQFQIDGLVGAITAFGDEVVEGCWPMTQGPVRSGCDGADLGR